METATQNSSVWYDRVNYKFFQAPAGRLSRFITLAPMYQSKQLYRFCSLSGDGGMKTRNRKAAVTHLNPRLVQGRKHDRKRGGSTK